MSTVNAQNSTPWLYDEQNFYNDAMQYEKALPTSHYLPGRPDHTRNQSSVEYQNHKPQNASGCEIHHPKKENKMKIMVFCTLAFVALVAGVCYAKSLISGTSFFRAEDSFTALPPKKNVNSNKV